MPIIGKLKRKREVVNTLRKYEIRLRRERKNYMKEAECYSLSDRKSRAMAVGECCLQVLEDVRELNRTHKLIDKSLEYMIDEQKVIDPDGRKGFRYRVIYSVLADEPKYSEAQIRAELEDTARRLKLETQEIFRKEADNGADQETGENRAEHKDQAGEVQKTTQAPDPAGEGAMEPGRKK